jgi:hypothetical protein
VGLNAMRSAVSSNSLFVFTCVLLLKRGNSTALLLLMILVTRNSTRLLLERLVDFLVFRWKIIS